MLNEADYRRETFSPRSVAVQLCDGSTWFIPCPAVSYRPAVEMIDDLFHPRKVEGSNIPTYDKIRKITLVPMLRYPEPRINDALAALEAAIALTLDESAETVPTTAETVGLMFDLSLQLLSMNYDLPDDAWPDLLQYNETTSEHTPIYARILSIGRGDAAPPVEPSPTAAVEV